jgi:hypothetical protein
MYWFNWNSDNPSLHPHKQDISSPISFSFPPTPCIGSPCDSPIHSARSSISIDENEIQNHIYEEYLKDQEHIEENEIQNHIHEEYLKDQKHIEENEIQNHIHEEYLKDQEHIEENEIQNHIHEEYLKDQEHIEENDTKTIILPNIGQLDHNKKEYINIPFVYYILEMKLKTHYKK